MFKGSVFEKIDVYDKVGVTCSEVNHALSVLKTLRLRFPFTENLREIEWLVPDRLFKVNPDEVGEFFRLIEDFLKPLGYTTMAGTNVYRNARLQIKEFKNLLRITVDDRKSLAKKIDAPWDRIGGLGQNKLLAKQIIFCFNYDRGIVLPIFSNQHLRHFTNRVVESFSGQTKYLSLEQEYEYYTNALLAAKNSLPTTKGWDVVYFARFLYQTYPPPDSERVGVNTSGDRKIGMAVSNEQLELQSFMRLLGELQRQGKISGEQFRDYRALWASQPGDREGLVERLRKL